MNQRGKYARLPLLIGALLLLTLIPFALFRGSQVPEAEAAWWNDAWHYRQRIDISNPNSSDLTDFQVSFLLDTATLISTGKLQAECQDIRITDNNGQELPFWIEENNPGCNAPDTKVWVKISSLPADGTTLYAYYGSAGTQKSSKHDGNKVFEFFDDFNGSSLDTNKWQNWETDGNYTSYIVSEGSLQLTGQGNTGIRTKTFSDTNYRVVSRIKDATDSGLLLRITDNDHLYLARINVTGNATDYYRRNGGWSSMGGGYTNFGTWTDWRIVEFSANGSSLSSKVDGTQMNTITDSTFSVGGIGLRKFGSSQLHDYVFVQKFADDEPTTATQAEEIGPSPVAYWKFDEGSGTTAFDSASYGLSDELLVDGDMEAANSGAWTASTDATLSKETSNPHGGSRVLRVANDSGSTTQVFASQEVLSPGKTYRVTGYARSDGVTIPKIQNYGQNVWQGTNSTEWQYFDVVFTAITTWGAEQFRLEGYFADGTYAEFDDISVKEIVTGNHGTITGATWADEDQCVSGKCLSFDGNDYVSVGSDPSLDVDTMSVSVWVYPTLSTGWYTIFQRADGAPNGYRLKISNTQKWAFSGGLSGTFAQSSQNVQANTWTHIVGTYDGIVNKIYVNGQLAASFEESGTLPSTAGEVAMIGSYGAGTSQNFPGLLDEVKIFPYALTEDEIKAEYNLGAAAVIGTGPAAPPPEGGNLDDSLVAHWAFDEQAGQTAHDRVGNNHGTFGADTNPGSDDPTWKLAGECKANGCASFDGGDYILRPTSTGSPLVVTNSSVTLSAWVNPSAYPASRGGIVGRQYASVFGYGVSIGSNGSFGILIRNSSDGFRHYDSSFSIPLNTWTHLVASIEDTDTATTLKFFVNGSLVATVTDAIQIVSLNDTSPILIGVESPTYSNFFQGKIDEVKIYNTALTPEQVLQDMNAGASLTVGMGADEADEIIDGAGAPPIAEWKFDENQGTTAYDTSGNGNNGTVNGAAWKSGCQQGACLEFDSSQGHQVLVTSSAFLNPTTDLTTSVWVKPSASFGSGANPGIVAKKSSWGGLWVSATTEQVWGRIYQSDGSQINLPSTTASKINPEQWTHLSLVANSQQQKVYLYINGQQVTSQPYNGTIKTGSDSLLIGAQGGEYFKGQIDHVKVYDYARTPAQIAYDYNRGAPVAHWRFDECEGTVAHDSSGNGNHGTINIGPSGSQSTAGTCQTSGAWANGKDGKFNGSLNFDGTDDYVRVPYTSSVDFDVTDSYSVSVWAKVIDATDGREIIHSPNGDGKYSYRLYVNSSSQLVATIYNGTSTQSFSIDYSSHFGKWTHIAFTKTDSQRCLYINSTLATSCLGFTLTGTTLGGSGPLQIGKHPSNVNHLKGAIDDVRIYNYALSPAQVLKVYNQGQAVNFTREN